MKLILVYTLTFLSFTCLSQKQDFNEYTTLQSEGQIPSDFSTLTQDKISQDIEKGRDEISSKISEQEFIKQVNQSIDDILHSGLVIYGDEISNYIHDVAQKVLGSDVELASKLRFYTIKSNVANAFSTDQGIVFVTTGLISQLENEAQLAYVLAHEISHFTENHVVQTYTHTLKNRYKLNIEEMSVYSKEKEFEADALGVKLYQAAGYSPKAITAGFDVLLYSYLPFDEVELPMDYFNNDLMYVPQHMFPTQKYAIKAEEDQDDSKSTHPNVKSRKLKSNDEIAKYENWGEEFYLLGEEQFKYIRNLSRFESIRTDIIDQEYANALYTIFLLEKEFPNSAYLQRRKAQVWLGISQLQTAGLENKYVFRSSEYEGEIAAMHFFLKKLDKVSTATVAMRKIEDIHNKYPEDQEILEIRRRMIKSLAYNEKFKIEDFSSKSYFEALGEYETLKNDTLTKTVEVKEGSKSKYDKIRQKKDPNDGLNFDTTKFYIYALSDLTALPDFSKEYKYYLNEKDLKDKESDSVKGLSFKEREKYYENKQINDLRIGMKTAIMFDPEAYHYNSRSIVYDKSEKIKENFKEAITNSIVNSDIQISTIARFNLNETATQGFNDRSLIITYFRQNSFSDKVEDLFPVDYAQFNDLKKRYNTSNLMYGSLSHRFYFSDGYPYGALVCLVPPLISAYYPIRFMRMHHTDLEMVIFNLDDPNKSVVQSFYFRDPPTKLNLESRLSRIFELFSEEQ